MSLDDAIEGGLTWSDFVSCLLEENQDDSHNQAPAWCFALLLGKYLMDECAFISLEDISDALPPYREEVVPVTMDKRLREAYDALEEEIRKCLKEHRGNSSIVSTMLNALLSWPDHPHGFGTLHGSEFDPETHCRERFIIAETVDLDKNEVYAKETRPD